MSLNTDLKSYYMERKKKFFFSIIKILLEIFLE